MKRPKHRTKAPLAGSERQVQFGFGRWRSTGSRPVRACPHGAGSNADQFSLPRPLRHGLKAKRNICKVAESSPSELAAVMRMSLPAVSQMVDRLFPLGLVTRAEAPDDRRRKRVTITGEGDLLLARIRRARATEYTAGTARLSQQVRAELTKVLGKALRVLPEEAYSDATPVSSRIALIERGG